MSLYRDQGVILRTHNLGEADRIVTIFMQQRGIVRAVAKGVRRTSSKFGARLEPFMLVDVQCYEGRNLDTVTQVETLGAYGAIISADFDTYKVANVIVETAERLNTDQPARAQYALVVGALKTLALGTLPAHLVRDSYLLRAVALAGWAPDFKNCVQCGAGGPLSSVSIALGGAVCNACRPAGSHTVDPGTLTLLGALLEGDWQEVSKSHEHARNQAAGFSSAYVQWHLERALKSLSHR